MSVDITYPSLKDMQMLYSKYSIIENKNKLLSALECCLDSSFLSTLTYDNIYDAYNKILMKYYPNEICIKSNFVNKVLLNGKKHVTIFELPIGTSRADLCKINGMSVAYEIKTDLDNFSRLQKQLTDYFDIFDEVYVICSNTNYNEIAHMIPDQCGIYTYVHTKRGAYHFDLTKKAAVNLKINPRRQLELLKAKELLNCFSLPDTQKTASGIDIIEYIIQNHSPAYINDTFKNILKKRYQERWVFLRENHKQINEIDYQWFYKNQIAPAKVYK